MRSSNEATRIRGIEQTGITIWGPSKSGKDWLLHSFFKELETFNGSADQELYFRYGKLEGGQQEPLDFSVEPPIDVPPTSDLQMLQYTFKREPRTGTGRFRSINTHVHNIIINNNAGKNWIYAVADPETFERDFAILFKSPHLLLVLGVPEEEHIEEGNMVENNNDSTDLIPLEERSYWSKRNYLNFMQMLLTRLEGGAKRNLAICMTKVDQLGYAGNPWDMLEYRHGTALANLLNSYATKHNIDVFATTSAGYIWQNNKYIPNIGAGSLRDREKWRPVNTAQPFFWIFEQIERERLGHGLRLFQNPLKQYIKYPEANSI